MTQPSAPEPATPRTQTPEPADPKSKAPILIAVGALVALLVIVALVAGLVSRTGPSGRPTSEMSATMTPLSLPIKVNEMQRDPNAEEPEMTPAPGSTVDTVSAIYLVDNQANLVVVAGRPVKDPNEMLSMVEARAVRQVGAGWCGRESSGDLDVCVVLKGSTAVMAGGLAQQPVDQIVAQAQAIVEALPE